MAEWLKAHAWKACVRETVPWVRIPLSPPAAHHHTSPREAPLICRMARYSFSLQSFRVTRNEGMLQRHDSIGA